MITTVSTTALPIEELPWPSFTICNQVLVVVMVVVVVMMTRAKKIVMILTKTARVGRRLERGGQYEEGLCD